MLWAAEYDEMVYLCFSNNIQGCIVLMGTTIPVILYFTVAVS